MPRRSFTSRKLRLVTINSVKHIVDESAAITTTNVVKDIAKAVNAPSNTVTTDCHHGATIKAIWISIDFCGLAGSGTQQNTVAYLFYNPGANLTPPGVLATGSSNEKKFIIKTWAMMTMRNQDGNPPYHWEGWIRIPKRYQRLGTDDIWQIVYGTSNATGHGFHNVIYKEYF